MIALLNRKTFILQVSVADDAYLKFLNPHSLFYLQ